MWSQESWCSCIMFHWHVNFHKEPFRSVSAWKPFSALFVTYSTLPISVSIPFFLPFPNGSKTSKHAWFSFMLFCTASMMQKNDTRCDAQTSVFLTPKTLFYTIPLWLVLFTQPWLRPGKKLLLRSVKKWSTFHVFPSSPTGKPIECQWGPFIVSNVKQVLRMQVTLRAGDGKEHLQHRRWYVNYLWVFSSSCRANGAVKTQEILPHKSPSLDGFYMQLFYPCCLLGV